LLTHGEDVMIPYIPKLLAAFGAAFSKYQAKNLLSLFDSVACLAGACTSSLSLHHTLSYRCTLITLRLTPC
jgi:hypothetical protein